MVPPFKQTSVAHYAQQKAVFSDEFGRERGASASCKTPLCVRAAAPRPAAVRVVLDCEPDRVPARESDRVPNRVANRVSYCELATAQSPARCRLEPVPNREPERVPCRQLAAVQRPARALARVPDRVPAAARDPGRGSPCAQ